ncbi:Carboxypeptidase regulatory-like domain-containing protein [Filimonas lacunae]|uniref:Carboxypeptidase regulatory-like domain-containing protein n=1 Tax=Filimonas lacunae TaxID=477680 RepID=A0A173MQP2_9BACT|nr:TonB-dependent receptor [Filimonas lacunae]BAV09807.1 outer membrane protein, nutrient binding [Filimonas lacunae]SIS79236.1 Carboxypeptidase regulatory-like domain-containing protein [Filimonas lacunae]
MKQIITITYILYLLLQAAYAQSFTQSVKGQVTDAESRRTLAGVSIVLMPGNIRAITDSLGFYHIANIGTGRYTVQYTIAGYEPQSLPDVVVNSGKEAELNIGMREDFKNLGAVTVTARGRKPLNEFAAVSARSFSMEDTKRYPASFSDPARMIMNFPGVSAGFDGSNEILVRGNSPQGVLWKLEGIEIPTPNHFSTLGSTGGPISMFSSNVIGKSDFYTGAFPANIGNATSAVFDMNFRNGNKDKREYTVQLGTLGAELGAEGPLNKARTASYLVNYRYSTLAILKPFIGLDQAPTYQDLSFKFNWNTKKAGEFTLFGLGGYDSYTSDPEKDSTQWNSYDKDNFYVKGNSKTGVIGLSHQIFVHRNAYIKTVVSASYYHYGQDRDTLNPAADYAHVHNATEFFTDKAFRFSTFYNYKISQQHTFRAGFISQELQYNAGNRYYDIHEQQWKQVLEGKGTTNFYQAYMQWKYRLTSQLTVNTGIHSSYLALNKKHSVEPRLSATYNFGADVVSLAAGMHSRPQHISTYLFENTTDEGVHSQPNKNLDMSRALHLVAGYEHTFRSLNLVTKAEVYYQHLYHLPVEENSNSAFSAVNMLDMYDLVDKNALVSTGKGKNYGIDLSVEKPFSNNYYINSTVSIYKSKYTDFYGKEYDTRFARNYSVNIIWGKEWQLRNNKHVGMSGKVLASGGIKNSVIDIPASIQTGKEEYVPGSYYSQRGPAYFRLDWSAYYRKDKKNSTHTLTLEIQNLTNRENFYRYYFDTRSGQQKTIHQLGLFPNLSYKIQFH